MNELISSRSCDIEQLKTISRIEWQVQNSFGDDSVGLFVKLTKNFTAQKLQIELSRKSFQGILICSESFEGIEKISRHIVVESHNWLEFQKVLLDRVYPFPSKKRVGITGTNGKSSTMDFFRQICLHHRKKVLSIGTLGVLINDEQIRAPGLTTLSYIDFRKLAFEYRDQYEVLVTEVSSHGLDQNRFFKVLFDAAAWTNFTQDHLDYHKTMQEYFKAKLQLPTQHLKPEATCFVPKNQTELLFKLKELENIIPKDIVEVTTPPLFLKSGFNRENLSMAMALFEEIFKIAPDVDKVKKYLTPPKGRLEVYSSGEKICIIDFAHTPDALKNTLEEITKAFSGRPIWCLFGCGGDRDRDKRPLMGRVAEELAEYIVITSDNPRTEEPLAIMKDIESGLTKKNAYIMIEDRRDAIHHGLEKMPSNGVLILAGKGHEETVTIGREKREFSERQIVLKFWEDQ